MSVMMPVVFKKRSLVYRQLADAEYTERSEGAIVYRMKGDSSEQVVRASLLDLSVVSRTGFRGINAAVYLQQAGLPVPVQPNQASIGDMGELILRLSQKEFWVLDGLTAQGDILDKLSQHALPSAACYSLFCQDSHAWFMLTGNHLADIMAKVCGVDLREDAFPVGSIAQTSVARVNAIVVSHQVNSIPVFSLLSDSASAEYLWKALLDAMQEFDGAVVGLHTLIETVEVD
jgi:sarcosine oxidase subunit gamma